MKIAYFKALILCILSLSLLSSCGVRKNIIYFQGAENLQQEDLENSKAKHDIHIMPGDNILITVSTINPGASEIFNTVKVDKVLNVSNLEWQGHVVDEIGFINFPVIGKLHLAGLTKQDAIELLQEKISKYVDSPIVNIRFLNYKVTVLGEVHNPGTYTVSDEKITLPQAIGLAGDMTIYGSRKNVLICRENEGAKKFIRIDMTSPNIFVSPYYYLQQNDIIYIQPNKAQSSSSTYSQNLPLIVSIISTAVTIFALIIK